VVDLASGKLQAIPLRFEGDIFFPHGTSDGKIIATGNPIHAAIWRFRPVR
jgi:hypothetical protein